MNFQAYLTNEDGDKPKSTHTIEGYMRDVELFAKFYAGWHGEPFTPSTLYRADAQAWLDGLLTQNYEPTTIIRKANALMAFVRYAKSIGAIRNDFNPLERLGLPTLLKNLAPRSLTPAERNRIERELEMRYSATSATAFQHLLAARLRAIIAVMQDSGLRVSEVCAITLENLFLDEKTPRIAVREGKGNTYADVPATDETIAKLKDWFALRPQDYKSLFDVDPRSVQREVAALGAAVGIPDLTPHRFRHTCAKRMVDEKTPLNYVQRIMRHKSFNTTARYCEPTMADLHQSANRAARIN